jgi:hypothetical protein
MFVSVNFEQFILNKTEFDKKDAIFQLEEVCVYFS